MSIKQVGVAIPDLKQILSTGLQFGHSTSKWNPKMASYIFGAKDGVHIIDVVQSRQMLETAAEVLQDLASKGEVVFVGTKRQAAELVKQQAMNAGAHFVTERWAGGLFTNFEVVKKSLLRLKELERLFEEGVEGRTKYEVVKMKDEWNKLNRLYCGVKQMEKLPVAMVVIDPKFDKVAVKEARKMHIPIVGLVDTNCDPDMVDYMVAGNDDALKSIELFISLAASAVLAGNAGKGVKYNLKDYTDAEVKIVKKSEEAEESIEEVKESKLKVELTPSPVKRGKGILEAVKDEADAKKAKTASKSK